MFGTVFLIFSIWFVVGLIFALGFGKFIVETRERQSVKLEIHR